MLILQLERFGQLSAEEKLALSGMSLRARRLVRGAELPLEEERADTPSVLLAGFGCRYVVLPNGRRQILAYLLPGDFCDRRTTDTFFPDHGVCAVSPVKVGCYWRAELDALSQQFPRIARALLLSSHVEQAIQRQWLLNVGHRNALERTAHLLCELYTRVYCLGLVQDGTCAIPFRQVDLADSLAISAVHLNRTLAEIRRRRLATFLRHQLMVEDLQGLQSLGGFHPQYLFAGHLPPQALLPTAAESASFQRLDSALPTAPVADLS
jgi:CRP-like cAMP-binding protein